MNKIVNTEANENNPGWVMGGNPRAIENQEARGQEQLCASAVLPTECRAEDRAKLEAAGVVFGKPVENDPLFTNVTLPTGWKLEPTDHSMWSKLLDDKGVERAGIFYKAAFYDRRADWHIPAQPK